MDDVIPTVSAAQRMPLAGKTSTLQPAAISLSPVFKPVMMHSGPFIRQPSANLHPITTNFPDYLEFCQRGKWKLGKRGTAGMAKW